MRDVSISELRARCFALIREVAMTKKPLRITRHGEFVAEMIPPVPEQKGRNFLGSGADTFDILDDDIVRPILDFTAD